MPELTRIQQLILERTMPKQTQIEKAIANLEAEIAVLQLAIAKLKQQDRPARKPRAVKPAERSA